jgi:hypothetical protein
VNGNKKNPLEELQLMAQIMSLTSVSSFDRYGNLNDDKDLVNGFNSSHVMPDDIIATLEIENKGLGNMKSLADQGGEARKVIPVTSKKGSLDYVKILSFFVELDLHLTLMEVGLGLLPRCVFRVNREKVRKWKRGGE